MEKVTTKEFLEYMKLKKQLFPNKNIMFLELDMNNPDHKRYNELSIKVAPILKSLNNKQ